MYKCLNCNHKFWEDESIIVEYGTGAVLSKIQLFGCPECESTKLQEIESGKIQKIRSGLKMKPVEKVYSLKSCLKCGASDFKSTDNSIDKIKDKDGFADIYPVRLCQKCNTYHGVDCDNTGIFMYKLNGWEIRNMNCKNWNFK